MSTNDELRLHSVDAFRGLALFGLFIVHMVSFYNLHWVSPKPSITMEVVNGLFGGKAYALFALLFGVSFHLIITNWSEQKSAVNRRFIWRMTLLFMLGYLHSLFFSSDILQVLALCGILLLALNSLSNTNIVLLAIFFLLSIPTFAYVGYLTFFPENASANPKFWHLTAISNNAAATQNFSDMILTNALIGQLGKWWFYLESGRLWNIIGFSLLGFWLARIRFFSHFQQYKKQCLPALLTLIAIALIAKWSINYLASYSFEYAMISWSSYITLSNYLNGALMLIGLLLLMFAIQQQKFASWFLVLAPMGRMTLTLYIAQSLLFSPLFFHYGLGLFGTITHLQAAILGILLGVLQIVIARLWFKRFYYGPLEWFWRCATLMKREIPFKKQPAVNNP